MYAAVAVYLKAACRGGAVRSNQRSPFLAQSSRGRDNHPQSRAAIEPNDFTEWKNKSYITRISKRGHDSLNLSNILIVSSLSTLSIPHPKHINRSTRSRSRVSVQERRFLIPCGYIIFKAFKAFSKREAGQSPSKGSLRRGHFEPLSAKGPCLLL